MLRFIPTFFESVLTKIGVLLFIHGNAPGAGEGAQLEPGLGAVKCPKIPTPGLIGIMEEHFPKSQGQIIPRALTGPPSASFQNLKDAQEHFGPTLTSACWVICKVQPKPFHDFFSMERGGDSREELWDLGSSTSPSAPC